MARGKGSGGYREDSPGKQRANAVQGARPKPLNFDGGYGNDTALAPLQANRATPTTAPVPTTTRPAPPPRPVTPLDAPDDRPDEPVTAGLPLGPGPGPEAIGMGGNPSRLASYLPALEVAASSPGSSMQLRQFVRILRGSVGG